ncbi:MAG: phosphoesterase [bacterium]|nr:phosphoesterase [bacterium]
MGSRAEIMVVGRDALLGERPFQGFSPAADHDYEALVLSRHGYAPREAAETDPSRKQPIAYCVIVNPRASLVFAYLRATGEGEYDEARLRGKWSIGIGGHVDRADGDALPDPVRASMRRELGEEIGWDGPFEPRIIGYINDDADMVGKVHFGLLYRLDTDARELRPRTREIARAAMLHFDEWRAMLDSPGVAVEGWSRIATAALLRDPGR